MAGTPTQTPYPPPTTPTTPRPNPPTPRPTPPTSNLPTANLPAAAPAAETAAGDTIGFRTPGFGVYAEANPPTEWDENRNMAWKTPMPGSGSSSPITLGDRIYLTAYSGYAQSPESPPGEIGNLKYNVFAIDRANGRIVWNSPVTPARLTIDYISFLPQHGYASSTLTTDGQRLFAFFGNSGGYAFDLNGQELWRIDCGREVSGFGSGASPVVHGENVIFNASVECKALIAVNRATGREAWRTEKQLEASYTTPLIVPVGGGHELVVASKAGLTGFDAATGEFLWEFHAGQHTEDYACVTPSARWSTRRRANL